MQADVPALKRCTYGSAEGCLIVRYDLANLTSGGINDRLDDAIVNTCQLLHNALRIYSKRELTRFTRYRSVNVVQYVRASRYTCIVRGFKKNYGR